MRLLIALLAFLAVVCTVLASPVPQQLRMIGSAGADSAPVNVEIHIHLDDDRSISSILRDWFGLTGRPSHSYVRRTTMLAGRETPTSALNEKEMLDVATWIWG